MTQPDTQQEQQFLEALDKKLWNAADRLRANLDAKDILGHVYEYFLGQFALAEGKKGGQYYTPKSIVSVIVAMLEPYSGKVYDPTMSSSGFFVQSESFIEAHGGKRRFNFENPVIFSLT